METHPWREFKPFCDQLRHLTKGDLTVSEFSRRFKNICDQLSDIGQYVDESDKTHWFLCDLGAAFDTFSIAICTSCVPSVFRDLLAQAGGHEMLLQSIHRSTPHVAFASEQDHHHPLLASPQITLQSPYLQVPSLTQHDIFHSSGFRGRGGRTPRGGRDNGHRPPHCQLCHTNGH